MKKEYFIPDATPSYMEVSKETIGNWAQCTGEVVLTKICCVPLVELFSHALGLVFPPDLLVPSGWVSSLTTSSLKWRGMNFEKLLVCFAFCITPEVVRCKKQISELNCKLGCFQLSFYTCHSVPEKILCHADRL